MSKRLMQTIFHKTNKSFVRRPLLWTVPLVLLTVLVFVSVSTLFHGVYGPKASGVNGSKPTPPATMNLATPTQQAEQISSATTPPSSQADASDTTGGQTVEATDFRSRANDAGKKLDDINARLHKSPHQSLEAYKSDIRAAQSAIKDARQAAQSLKKEYITDAAKQRQVQTLLDTYTDKLNSAVQSYNSWIGTGNPAQYAHAEEQRAAASAAGTLFYDSVSDL